MLMLVTHSICATHEERKRRPLIDKFRLEICMCVFNGLRQERRFVFVPTYLLPDEVIWLIDTLLQ